jgi:hypothetical protein
MEKGTELERERRERGRVFGRVFGYLWSSKRYIGQVFSSSARIAASNLEGLIEISGFF